jgi:hypothetical protein
MKVEEEKFFREVIAIITDPLNRVYFDDFVVISN